MGVHAGLRFASASTCHNKTLFIMTAEHGQHRVSFQKIKIANSAKFLEPCSLLLCQLFPPLPFMLSMVFNLTLSLESWSLPHFYAFFDLPSTAPIIKSPLRQGQPTWCLSDIAALQVPSSLSTGHAWLGQMGAKRNTEGTTLAAPALKRSGTGLGMNGV